MTPEPLTEEAVFQVARKIRATDARADYLRQVCADNDDLRARVKELLRAHDEEQSFLESPAAAPFVPTIIDRRVTEAPGTQIGPYKLLEQIGEGGFGIVYMAEQSTPVRRKVALKVLKLGMDTREVIARFEAERQALALMDHPHIAKVFDGGATDSGRPYFVMELVRGVPITDFCDQNHLTPRERLELFITVCRAVQHAHQKGIIHRDIKPSNVLVTLQDDKPVVKVIDFGVAKALGQELTEKTLCTSFAQMIGTPLYMSPEQAGQSSLDIDTRSDIYSLGVLLYELLTGTTPFDKQRLKEAAFGEIQRIIREEDPPRPSTRLSDLGKNGRRTPTDRLVPRAEALAASPSSRHSASGMRSASAAVHSSLASISAVRKTEPHRLSQLLRGELDWIVMKALEKDRTRRYATALGLASDVEHYLADEPVEACPPSAAYRFRKFARRNKAALAMVATVAAALVVAVVGLVVSNVLVTAERDQKIRALGEREAALREAHRQKELAIEKGRIATEQELLAKRGRYASQMNLAMEAWESGDAARTLDLLESQRPAFDQEDLRSFEWYYLWRLCHRGLRARLNHSERTVYSAVFLADGTLASVGDRSIKLWDGKTAEQKLTISSAVWGIAVCPDGKTIGSWGEGDPTRLWDVGSGKQLAVIEDTGSHGFSSDGKTIAVCRGEDVEFRDLATRELRGVLRRKEVRLDETSSPGSVFGPGGFIFSPDGNTAVFARDAKGLIICRWDGADWHEDNDIRGHGGFQPAAFSPNGAILAVGGEVLRLYAADTGQPLGTLAGHTGAVYGVAFAPDGQTLASAGVDRTVRFWNVATRQQGASLPHPGPVYSVAYAPDGKSLATAGAFGTLRLWDTAPLEDEHSLLQQPGGVLSLALSPDGKTLAASSGSPDGMTLAASSGRGTTTLWDLATRQATVTLTGGGGCVLFSHDGRRVAGVRGADIEIWDIPERTLTVLRGHSGRVYSVAFSPDDKTLVSASHDETVRLWDLATRETRVTLSPGKAMSAVAFSPDGKTVATGSSFEYVELWDATTGRALLPLQGHDRLGTGPMCMAVAFSPDGRALAAASQSGLVRLWDTATGRLRAVMQGHTTAVNRVAFSPDGKTLATAGNDYTVRLWDTATGQEKATFKAHEGIIRGLAFSGDGSLLVTGSSDGAIRLWQTSREPAATDVRTEFDVENADSLAALIDAASRLNLTARLTEAGQIQEEALARLEKMASAFPNDVRHGELLARGRNQLANLLIVARDANVRDARRALELARQAVAVDPQSWIYRHTLGIAHYRAGDWNEAATELEKAMQSGWPEWIVSFFPAMSYWKLGKKEQAREAYEHAARIMKRYNPDYEPDVRQRDEAAELLGLLPPAPSGQGATASPWKATFGAWNWYERGKWFYRQGRFAEAESFFREAEAEFRELIPLYPKSANGHFGLGWVFLVQKKHSKAIESLHDAIGLEPERAEIRAALGWALLDHGEPVEAEAAFREQIRLKRDSVEGLAGLGRALGAQNKLVDAEAALLDAVRLDPADITARIVLSTLRAEPLLARACPAGEKRDWKTAAAELGDGFKLAPPEHTLAWFSLALARVLAGDLPGYEALARQIPERFSGREDFHVISACLLRAEGAADPAELLRWARQAYEAQPNNMTAYNLGLAHYRAGEFKQAREHIEEARTIAEWFLCWPALAMAHHRRGQADMAREWLDKAEASFRDFTNDNGQRLKYFPRWQDWAYFEALLLEAREVIGREKSK